MFGAAPRTPSAPEWQAELQAARLIETTALFTSARSPSELDDRRHRIATMYRELAAKYPREPGVQKAAGDGLSHLDEPNAAIAFWERSQALDPADAGTAEALGSAYLRLGRVRDACGQLRRAMQAAPDIARHHFALANVLYIFRHQLLDPPALPDEQAVLAEALAHFRRAAELAPADKQMAQAYAETLYVLARPDWNEALCAWRAVLSLSGKDTDFANSHLARVSLRLGRAAEALAYLDRIHGPAFDELKAKLRAQARKLDGTATDSGQSR